MARTVSDQLITRLVEWSVRRVYGYPGDSINGVMGALHRAQDKVEFVQTQHWGGLAAFMATAHAKFAGEVGVCASRSRARARSTCSLDCTTSGMAFPLPVSVRSGYHRRVARVR